MKQILQLITNRRFFLRLLLLFLSLILIPISLEAFFSTNRAREEFREQQLTANEAHVDQISASVDAILSQIATGTETLMLDPAVMNYLLYSRGDYYESLSGQLDRRDLPMLYDYLTLKSDVTERFELYKASNQYIHSLYLYDNRKSFILYSEGPKQSDIDGFYDLAWLETAQNIESSPTFMKPRTLKYEQNVPATVLTVLFKINPDCCFIVNVNTSYLYNNFIAPYNAQPDHHVFAISPDDLVIVGSSTAKKLLKPELSAMIHDHEAQTGSFYYTDQSSGIEYLVHISPSEKFDWTFVSMAPSAELIRQANNLTHYYFTSSGLLILVFLIISIAAAFSIYRPIAALLRDLAITDANVSEFEQIRHALFSARQHTADYKARLEENLTLFRSNFVFSLLKGRISDEKEIQNKLDYFKLKLKPTDLYVMIFSLRGATDLPEAEINLRYIRANDILCKYLEPYNGILEKTEFQEFIVLANCKDEQLLQLFDVIDAALNELETELDLSCYVAMSLPFCSISQVSLGYQQTKEVLLLVEDDTPYGILSYKDYVTNIYEAPAYSPQKLTLFHGLLRQGRAEEAIQCLQELLDEVPPPTQAYQRINQQLVRYKILDEILAAANAHGLQKQIFSDFDPTTFLTECDNAHLVGFLSDLIRSTCTEISSTKTSNQTNYIQRVTEMLEENCGYDMSLNYIAEQLGTSPSYISRLIKERTGSNFMNLLTHQRLLKGRELLAATDMPIKDIANEVGYSNSHYFIKLFKERTGMTPGEYRQMALEGRLQAHLDRSTKN